MKKTFSRYGLVILAVVLIFGLVRVVSGDSSLGIVTSGTWQGDVIGEEYLEGGGGGSDVKSGTVATTTEGSTSAVSFTSSFTGTPQCVVSFNDSSTEASIVQVESEATTGFTIRVLKIGGGANADRGVGWICTDASN